MTVVDEAGFAGVGEDDVEVRAGLGAAPEEVAGDLDVAGLGEDLGEGREGITENPGAAAEPGEGHEAVLKTVAVADGIVDGVAVGGEGEVGGALAKDLGRLEGEDDSLAVAVAVFHGVVLVEKSAGAHKIAGESDGAAVDLADEHAAAMGVALGGDDFEFDAFPGEGFVVEQLGIDGYVLADGEEGAAVVVVVIDALVAPEVFGVFEEVALVFRYGDFRTAGAEAVGSPALVAVVVGVEDPVDLADADLGEVVDDCAGTGVDEDGAIAGRDAVDVAGVGPAVQVLGESRPGHFVPPGGIAAVRGPGLLGVGVRIGDHVRFSPIGRRGAGGEGGVSAEKPVRGWESGWG